MDDRERLLSALEHTQQKMLTLVESLSDDQLQVPYHPGVNPPLWEAGHCAFFYETFILKPLDGVPSHDPSMDDLWDSFHVDHEDRWSPGLFPDKQTTLAYQDSVYRRIHQRIQTQPLTPAVHYLYKYAIFHQNMHIESMLWCRQTEGYPPPPFAELESAPSSEPLAEGDVTVPGGTYRIGMPAGSTEFAARDFAFDNEKPGFDVTLPAFRISPTLVSNRQFQAFVEAGGYERPELWSFGGRKWLQTPQDMAFGTGEPTAHKEAPRHPVYWRRKGGQWYERHFDQWLPLEASHPVKHVSYWEVEAYCNWAGRRLPTEFEWEVAALGNPAGETRQRFPWGDAMDPERVDMDGRHFARVPVDAYAGGDSPFGCRQMIGTLWEWTSNQFLPYDGFAVDMYPFMSTLQFGDHKTTRGGSCATYSNLIRGTYRQAYHPARQDVFVGFRTCALDATAKEGTPE
ncbi:selenoneine synthase SenA [Marinobacteraceae bacterium S3BR75-40.1]